MHLKIRKYWLAGLLLLLPLLATAEEAVYQGLQGDSHRLSDYTGGGKWTVVMIWSAHCGVCAHEAPAMERFHRKGQAGNAMVVGISADGAEGAADARAFVRELGLSFPNMLADGEEVALLFHEATGSYLAGTPGFLVFDPEGELRTYQQGSLNIALLERFIAERSRLAAVEER